MAAVMTEGWDELEPARAHRALREASTRADITRHSQPFRDGWPERRALALPAEGKPIPQACFMANAMGRLTSVKAGSEGRAQSRARGGGRGTGRQSSRGPGRERGAYSISTKGGDWYFGEVH